MLRGDAELQYHYRVRISVPDTPEEAQTLLYLLLGRAVAQCQIAEAHAATIHRVLLGKEPRSRSTLGAKAKAVEQALPGPLREEYRSLVDARNYLVHELLSDHGGWTGVVGLDGPDLYRSLFASIDESMATIERVSAMLTQHLLAVQPDFHAFRLGDDGVYDLRTGLPLHPPDEAV